MKRLSHILLAGLALAGLTACEDARNEYLEDYQTVVYFRNGGEQAVTLYRTGEEAVYAVPVCKSGRDLDGTATVRVVALDDTRLSIYNYTNETDYTAIPEDFYVFLTEDESCALTPPVLLEFGPDDAYKVLKLRMDTNAVSALMEADPTKHYVLALQLLSDDKLGEGINLLVLTPGIDIPLVALSRGGVESYRYTSASARTNVYTNTVILNMDENRWDFDCTLEVLGKDWLDAYNTGNGTAYELLPEDAWQLSTERLSFRDGARSADFELTVDRDGMDMLQEYALPVRIASCSKPEFNVGEDVYLLNVRMDPDKIDLDAGMVSVSHNQDGDGTGAPALVDGNAATYWHSPWSAYVTDPDPVYGIYVDIALNAPLKSIVLSYMVRSSNNNGRPTHVAVGVSNDGAAWTQVGDAQTAEMASAIAGQVITLPVCKAEETFRYIRLGIAESASGDLRVPSSGAYTALSEIELYGTAN